METDFLLNTQGANALYESVRQLPIIDFHNHLSVTDLANDRSYENITQLWISTDPYKHRLMRICGVDEHFITGNAEPYEKFEKYCEIFPSLAGNPVYDWSRMELAQVFGIHELPTAENARYLYDKAGELLSAEAFTHNAILKRFHVAYHSPVAALTDDLSGFNGKDTAPSLRGDNLLAPDETLKKALTEKTGIAVTDRAACLRAICVLLDDFAAAGCRFADHALDAGFFAQDVTGEKTEFLARLGVEYAKRGWTLLLHLDANRTTSSRLRTLAGPAGGYAAVGGSLDIMALTRLLGRMEELGGLPDTVLFPLNMADQAPLAVLQGSFSQDGVSSKVQLGPAWWWCDHALGIRNTLECIASFGVVSRFIGMTTDSRSVLSFARHDYFRRLLCSWLAEKNEIWELPFAQLSEIAKRISYENALEKVKGGP